MYVAFAWAGRRWVLPAEDVAAVGPLGPVTRLAMPEPGRLGLALHQGRVVTLVAPDRGSAPGAAAEFALRSRGPTAGHLVVLRAGGGTVAFPADELLGLKVEYGAGVPAGFELLEAARLGPPAEVAP